MAKVQFLLSAPIELKSMIPATAGVATEVPAELLDTGGLYLILNQKRDVHNRYMGTSDRIRTRFRARQGACFDLGLDRSDLDNVLVYTGTVKYKNDGDTVWKPHEKYSDTTDNMSIQLDDVTYDVEHLFIKVVQYVFSRGTITNSRKVGEFKNYGPSPIEIELIYPSGSKSIKESVIIVSNGAITRAGSLFPPDPALAQGAPAKAAPAKAERKA